VDRVLNLSPERLTMQCILSEVEARKQGQFPVRLFNPYIIDAQLHSVLIWTQHFYREGCLPSKLSHFEQFAAIPFGQPFYVSMEVQTKTKAAAVVNIIAHDAQGQVYNRLLGGEFTVSKRLNERFKQAAETQL
jgi:hypothetical protein